MNFNNAKKQFNENRINFGDPGTQPENYNLYAGLENLAAGLDNLQRRLDAIEELLRILISRQ